MMFRRLLIAVLVAALLAIGASGETLSSLAAIDNPMSPALAQEAGDGGSTEGGNPGLSPLQDMQIQVALGGSGEEGNPGRGC